MDRREVLRIDSALSDFRGARRKAILTEVLGRFQGNSSRLLSFEEARQKLHTQMTGREVTKDIPLDHIVGSVNRYEDFTRGFLPRASIDSQRWASVKAAQFSMTGLAPIEVYQIDQVYFVLDGNHRVSVARQMGIKTIQAHVTEIPTRIKLTPDIKPDDLIIKAEYLDFLDATCLDLSRPQADLEMTAPGQYPVLLEHIRAHQQYLKQEKHRDVNLEETAVHWYDKVYLPVIKIILGQGLLRDFPGRSEADLYVWLLDKKSIIEKELGINVEMEAAAGQLVKQFGSSFHQVILRSTQKLVEAFTPRALEEGPAPGEWRKEVVNYRSEKALFNAILVPVSGTEESWKALDQAKIVVEREEARLQGLHIISSKRIQKQSKALQIQEEFTNRCRQAGLEGQLTLAKGDPAQRISERAAWNDLVVINLSYPAQPRAMNKFRSGFRSLVLHCPRPILAVPHRISPLNRALLAYDASSKAQEALYVATYLAGKWDIPLVVLTIQEGENPTRESQARAREYLETHGIQATYEDAKGPVAPSILIIAEEEKCDWIIMGGYGTAPVVNFMLDNVVDQVLRSSGRPMLLCR